MAREERIRRAALKKRDVNNPHKECGSKHSGKYALSEIVVCAECGQPYRRQVWSKNGEKKAVWRCNNRLRNGTKYCKHSPTINEETLHEAIIKAVNKVIYNKAEFIDIFRENVVSVLKSHSEEKNTLKYDKKIEILKEELSKMISEQSVNNISEQEFDDKYKAISEKIDLLKLEKYRQLKDNNCFKTTETRINSINKYLNGISEMTEYDDVLTRKLIESIGVVNDAKMEVRFKSGIFVEQRFDGIEIGTY